MLLICTIAIWNVYGRRWSFEVDKYIKINVLKWHSVVFFLLCVAMDVSRYWPCKVNGKIEIYHIIWMAKLSISRKIQLERIKCICVQFHSNGLVFVEYYSSRTYDNITNMKNSCCINSSFFFLIKSSLRKTNLCIYFA